MKLERILDKLNTIEKISFSKILDFIINNRPKNYREIDKILNNYSDRELKKLDSHIIAKVFSLVEDEYFEHLNKEINRSVSQLDILIDILIRDGNSIMSREWLGKLYEKEIKKIKSKIRGFKDLFEEDDINNVEGRDRDYLIYRHCMEVAYKNDEEQNQDAKISFYEKTILNALATKLDLSQEEVKLINYSILPLKVLPLDDIIELLKCTGAILYSKKNLKIYIPDEFAILLRKFRGKEVADKYLRRILKLLKDSHINLLCRRHSIDRKLDRQDKTKAIILEGIGLRNILKYEIHKEGTNVTEKKKFINDLVEKGLNITHLKGTTIDAKLDNLITYFSEVEREDKVGISMDGYGKLLEDLEASLPRFNNRLKAEFELQAENVMDPGFLLDYNLKPRDILETISFEDLKKFCDKCEISTRGNEVLNILGAYKDSKNIQLENYINIAFRNLNMLKENGIRIKEADLGNKFEELTRFIFQSLGFNVDEVLRKAINTSKDKIDILLRVSEEDVILVECKSVKEHGYNKFSSVYRQVKAYKELLEKNNLRVVKSLLVAPDYSDDFINECEIDYELNLSLIKAQSLVDILYAFKQNKKFKALPQGLLMKDVVIQEERVIKALQK